MKTMWKYAETFKDLRLIQPSIVKDSVDLLNNFSQGMYSISKDFKLTIVEHKELFDKVTKGNEGLVADFVNSNRNTLKKISKILGVKIVNFALTFDHHGADGYFLTNDGQNISVELKTTGAKIIPKHARQRRKSNTTNNIEYSAEFKYHFTDTSVSNMEDKFKDFDKEIKNYKDRKQVTLFAGILDNNGYKSVVDLFFLTTDQSVNLLNWYKDNRKFDGHLMQFSPSSLMEGGKLHTYCNHVYSEGNI